MKIHGRKEFIATKEIDIKDTHIGSMCDENHIIVGININYKEPNEPQFISLKVPNVPEENEYVIQNDIT